MDEEDEPRAVESIDVSLRARSKSGRYYGESALRERLASLDSSLFRTSDGAWYLKTRHSQSSGPQTIIVIIFDVEGETATVVSQTSDHYDWSSLEYVPNPPFSFPKDST